MFILIGKKIAGENSYFLKKHCALLISAICNFGLLFMIKKNYTLMYPPQLVPKSLMKSMCTEREINEEFIKVIIYLNL